MSFISSWFEIFLPPVNRALLTTKRFFNFDCYHISVYLNVSILNEGKQNIENQYSKTSLS
jgi:hypothetical protein